MVKVSNDQPAVRLINLWHNPSKNRIHYTYGKIDLTPNRYKEERGARSSYSCGYRDEYCIIKRTFQDFEGYMDVKKWLSSTYLMHRIGSEIYTSPKEKPG